MSGAPDMHTASGGLPEAPPCPFCEGTETELVNPFGSQLSVSTYWCRRCRSPFEIMKWLGRAPGAEAVKSEDGARWGE